MALETRAEGLELEQRTRVGMSVPRFWIKCWEANKWIPRDLILESLRSVEPNWWRCPMCVHLTLCDPTDYNLLNSCVHGIFQARTLEWIAISFSKGSSQIRDGAQGSWIAVRFCTAEPLGKPKAVLAQPLFFRSFLFQNQENLPHSYMGNEKWNMI